MSTTQALACRGCRACRACQLCRVSQVCRTCRRCGDPESGQQRVEIGLEPGGIDALPGHVDFPVDAGELELLRLAPVEQRLPRSGHAVERPLELEMRGAASPLAAKPRPTMVTISMSSMSFAGVRKRVKGRPSGAAASDGSAASTAA